MTFRILTQLLLLTGPVLAGIVQNEFELTRQTVDGGGATLATGGDFELFGTIGQPDAGALTGGEFALTGGFWFATPPGDCNQDGGVGLLDAASFDGCLNGPSGDPAAGRCRCFDLDPTGTIDLADFAALQLAFAGH